jgi:CBS domain-containing protein
MHGSRASGTVGGYEQQEVVVRVRDIIRSKGNKVAVVSPDDTIENAVRLLSEWRVGALVVSAEEGSVDGILSERDVVRHLHGGSGTLELAVADLMTADVVTCGGNDTVADLMELMTERRIRHLPVIEDDTMVGIVSIGDVVKARLAELEDERKHLEDYITTGR